MTVGPISIGTPVPIGPFEMNFPFEICFTIASTLTGEPCRLSVWPPRLRLTFLPTPVDIDFSTTTGSHISAKTPPDSFSSIMALSTTVPSSGDPPPGLSPISASTIGPFDAFFTCLSACRRGTGVTRKSRRMFQAISWSSLASLSASFWSLLVVTMKLIPASGMSLQGKPAATVIVSTPGSFSILWASSSIVFIGCFPVNWTCKAGSIGGCMKPRVGLSFPSSIFLVRLTASTPLS